MRPRVFVSSVVEGYREYREAARRGIEAAGCEPVLVNEDFPALATSPRNACLDAVRSCDAYAGILGERAGSVSPSGKLIVEEEFDEAEAAGLPVLVFVEEGEHEERQEEFIARVSAFIDGRYRHRYTSPEELAGELERAVSALGLRVNEDRAAAANSVQDLMGESPLRSGRAPTLKVALAPTRREEVIPPTEMAGAGRRLLDIGHSEPVGLLDYGSGYSPEVSGNRVHIAPIDPRGSGEPHSRAGALLTEQGDLLVEANLTDLRDRGRNGGWTGSQLLIVEGDLTMQLGRVFAYARELYDAVDPYEKCKSFLYQVGVFGASNFRLAPEAEAMSRGPTTMRVGDPADVTADPEPRELPRRRLAEPDDEVQRALARFRQVLSV